MIYVQLDWKCKTTDIAPWTYFFLEYKLELLCIRYQTINTLIFITIEKRFLKWKFFFKFRISRSLCSFPTSLFPYLYTIFGSANYYKRVQNSINILYIYIHTYYVQYVIRLPKPLINGSYTSLVLVLYINIIAPTRVPFIENCIGILGNGMAASINNWIDYWTLKGNAVQINARDKFEKVFIWREKKTKRTKI